MTDNSGFHPGINRVTLADHPLLPTGIAGTEVHTWLAIWGLARRMKEEVPSLDIPDIQLINVNDRATVFVEYADRFDNLLRQGNPEAHRLADQLGLVFTSLIYTLKRSPADVRESRKDWPAAQWEARSRVKRINIGGGRFETHLGKQMARVAVDRLGEFDLGDVHLKLSDHPQHLPCLGVASTLPDGPALIMDAGHTLIKRVRVEVRDREVTKLEILPRCSQLAFLKSGHFRMNWRTVFVKYGREKEVSVSLCPCIWTTRGIHCPAPFTACWVRKSQSGRC